MVPLLTETQLNVVVPSMVTVDPPQLLPNEPSAANFTRYVPPVTSPPDAATTMTLVNQSAPAGVPGEGTLFMRNGGVVFAALKPSQAPGIFIVVHAEAIGAEIVVTSSATTKTATNLRYRSVKPLEQPRRMI